MKNRTKKTRKRVPTSIARIDPTRTGTLRNGLERELVNRFSEIAKLIKIGIEKEDWLGVKEPTLILSSSQEIIAHTRFKFLTNPEKIEAFRSWLRNLIEVKIKSATVDTILERYVNQGYRKGTESGYRSARRKGSTEARADMGLLTPYEKEFVSREMAGRPTVDKLKALTSRVLTDLDGITDEMETRIMRVLADGLVRGSSPLTIAEEMMAVVYLSKNRARTLARTEIVRAHAEGTLDAMERLGIEEVGIALEWETTGKPCPACKPMDGVILKIAEARGMIPRHPNAVFAGSTFISYGECEELVRAWYDGPAVVLSLRGGRDRTTIGPNHPILTRRGMVKAAELKKGDEVLYDTRGELSSTSVNLKQIPFIEDVFSTLLLDSRNGTIVTTSSDLHGDVVFCKGEVQAIRPTSGLLPILDSFGVEKLRQGSLAGTDPQLEIRPGFSSGDLGSQGVLLSASPFVSKGGQLGRGEGSEFNSHSQESQLDGASVDSVPLLKRTQTFSGDIQLPDFFHWEMVHDISFSKYVGWAFDATTATSLYYSSGLVVSNCRCAWVTVDPSRHDKRNKKSIVDGAIRRSRKKLKDDFKPGIPISKDRPIGLLNSAVPDYPGLRTISNLLIHGITSSQEDTAVSRFSGLLNVFCPTGEGGGIDPTCSPSKSRSREVPAQVVVLYPLTDNVELMKSVMGTNPDGLPAADKVAGALPGSKVKVKTLKLSGGRSLIEIETIHKKYESTRYITIHPDGRKEVTNASLYVRKKYQGEGIGTAIFANQVKYLREIGFDSIHTQAARSNDMNGHYTWPRLGYDQSIDDFGGNESQILRKIFPAAKSVLDIMRIPKVDLPPEEFQLTKEKLEKIDTKRKLPPKNRSSISGMEWWLANGYTMAKAKFDLRDGSESMKILNSYLATKSSDTPTKNSSVNEYLENSDKKYEEIELSESEEYRLDMVWKGLVENVFCPTGKGGGVDPTCSTMPRGDKGEKVGKGSKTAALEGATKEMDRLKDIKGGVTPRHLTSLRKNLEGMTVKQLNGFKKTHGVKASGKKKAELVSKLESRLLDKLNKKKSDTSKEGQMTADDFDKALLSFSSNLLADNSDNDTTRVRLIAEILAELIDDPKEEELDELINS